MQTWARRGLQTALVTGGLLMLGTGIASASENVNPDRPASGLDGQISAPVDFHDNQIATPLGDVNLPDYHTTLKTPDLGGELDKATDAMPKPVAQSADKVADKASQPVSKVTGKVSGTLDGVTSKAQQAAGSSALPTDKLPTGNLPVDALSGQQAPSAQDAAVGDLNSDDPLRGNTITGDISVPLDVSGNAIALGAPSHVESTDASSHSQPSETVTEGNGSLSGNVVGLDWALPVQVTGNAIALGSEASSKSASYQESSVGGDVTTSGDDGVLAGNILLGQLATPVQLTGNAIAGGGHATSESTAVDHATADGTLGTSGNHGLLSGNAGGAPVALPVGLSGNGLAGLGEATSDARTGSEATAGANDRPGRIGVPTYIDTAADHSLLSGTAAGPSIAGPLQGNGNAGTLLGHAETSGITESTNRSGGFLSSSGKHAIGSGSIVNPSLATPADVISNAVAGGGYTEASAGNKVDSQAGASSYTNGEGSLLSATNIANPVAYPIEAFGNAGAVGGLSEVDPTNTVDAQAGGYNGTIGTDSLLTANEIETPLAGALEGFGNSVAAVGGAVTHVSEDKTVTSDGGGNTDDDAGVLSANLVQAAGSLPVQVFGGSVAGLGHTTSNVSNDSDFTGGGSTRASGKGGFAAGNIVQAPLSVPGQVTAQPVSVLGDGLASIANDTSSSAGGDAVTTGEDGTITGDVVSLPVASAAQLFGDATSVAGFDLGGAINNTTSTAGGTVTTNGDNGTLAGDVVSGQALPVLQGFGDTVGVLGGDNASALNNTVGSAGGDITTSGENAALSGDVLDFPVAFVGQAFGDGVGLFSHGIANGDNVFTGTVGGEDTSSSSDGFGSGIVSQNPVGIVGQIYDVELPIFSNIVTSASNDTLVTVADQPARYTFPIDGGNLGGLPVTSMPKLPDLGALPAGAPSALASAPRVQSASPANPVQRVASSLVDGARSGSAGLPGVAGIPDISALPELPGMSGDLAPHATRSMATQDGPVVPGASNLDLNLADLGGMLPTQAGELSPVSNPGLSGLDTAPLQQAFAKLQNSAGNLGQQAGGLHSAGSSLTSFTGNLPLNGGSLPTV